jgi:hypothetical protein
VEAEHLWRQDIGEKEGRALEGPPLLLS